MMLNDQLKRKIKERKEMEKKLRQSEQMYRSLVETISGQEERPAKELQVDQFCQIFVEDNGIGFDEKYLDHIFGVFQRLHGHDNYDGTGIGLANCRKIVEYHGGSITAKSTPGKGSIFVVNPPVKQPKNESTINQ